MPSSAVPLPSFHVSRKSQAQKIFPPPLSLSNPCNLRFPPITAAFFSVKSSAKPSFHSSQPLQNDVLEEEEEEEEEDVIGDCLVYEDGIFDDPFLQNNGQPSDKNTSNDNNSSISPSPENLIPDKWLEVQKELNITKKERRKLSQQLEFGRKIESRRQGLLPIEPEEFEKIKNEKLKQLKPLVLDNPELKYSKDDEKRNEDVRGRVAARNPRLAVYGGGLEEISQLFSSGSYESRASDNSKVGTRKLFSREEKSLINRRVPDLVVATSGKWHPLHTLAASGEFYLVNALLKHNLDINVPDKEGLTVIHKAILGKKQAIFNFLLRESANPFVRDAEGATLLHYAVFAASSQMIKILLLYNVDINIQDNDGWTALHLAVQSRRTDIVRLLLIKGANTTLRNRDGLTPLDICLYSGRDTRTYELIKLIKRHS